jgi:hypothetical protein
MSSDTRLGPANQNGISGNHGYEGSASQLAASPLQESPRLPQRNYNNTFASCTSSAVLFSIQSSSVQYCTHFYTARICMYITYSVACRSYLFENGANEIASRSRGSTHPQGPTCTPAKVGSFNSCVKFALEVFVSPRYLASRVARSFPRF